MAKIKVLIIDDSALVRSLLTQIVNRLPDGAAALRAKDLGLVVARIGFGRDPEPAQVELTRQMMLATSRETRRDAVLALAGLDFTDQLDRIDRPTLVIGGTADVIAPIAESRRMARRIHGARLEEVAGGGHMLMLERAALVDDLIVDFAHSVQAHADAAHG